MKKDYSVGGHWVTINGNHVFIEDSPDDSKGEKVLKAGVEKTQPPVGNDAEDKVILNDRSDEGDESSPNGGSRTPADDKSSVWKTVGNILINVASAALGAMSASQSGGGYSASVSSGRSSSYGIQQYKSQINNLVQSSKTSLSQEYDKMEKMIKEVSAMPKGHERDSKWQQVLSKGAELDNAKAIINNIEAFNNHDMPEKIVDEVNKFSSSLPKNYIEYRKIQGGGSEPQSTNKFETPPVQYFDKMIIKDYDKAKMDFIEKWRGFPNERDIWSGAINVAPFLIPEIPIGKYYNQVLEKIFPLKTTGWHTESSIMRGITKYCQKNPFVNKKLITEEYQILKANNIPVRIHGMEKIYLRLQQNRNLSLKEVIYTYKMGNIYTNKKGELWIIRGQIKILINKYGEIITFWYQSKGIDFVKEGLILIKKRG